MITFKPHEALTRIAQYLPEQPVIVEAGAFNGTETVRFVQKWPKATVHAFEPVPELYRELKQRTYSLSQVHCYQLALANHTGTASLHISEKPTKPGKASQASSLLRPTQRLQLSPLIYPHTIEVNTITLDDWAQKYQIKQVDLLWLDVQGNTLPVLMHAEQLLQTVSVIYAEVEFISAYEGQALYPEVKRWLEQKKFVMVGKDFPNQPTWFFGNTLFIKQ